MKPGIILNDEEIEELLKIKYDNLGDAIKQIKSKFKDFNLQESKKSQFMFEIATNVSGKIENNPKDLICPNCKGKYVVRTYAGDLYYRLYHGTKEQRERESKKFENMGLYNNPWAIVSEDTTDYWCLNCGIRWNM